MRYLKIVILITVSNKHLILTKNDAKIKTVLGVDKESMRKNYNIKIIAVTNMSIICQYICRLKYFLDDFFTYKYIRQYRFLID